MSPLPTPHSPLGGSGAARWMKCAASPAMSAGVEDPESEHAALGTAAHALGEMCLYYEKDAWEYLGHGVVNGSTLWAPGDPDMPESVFVVDKDMADAVQEYLDAVRSTYPDMNQGNTWVERAFHCPLVHPLFYGKADFVYLEVLVTDRHRLHVRDYKHGVGIVVGVEGNPQGMYYAVGMLTDLDVWDLVDEVVIWIDQPRAWMDSPRSWTVSTEELARWRDEELVPAMDRAQATSEAYAKGEITTEELLEQGLLVSGEHCRFCPARYRACPRHVADTERLEELMEEIEAKGGAPKATNAQLGEFLTLFEVMKIRQKAARESAHSRAEKGAKIPGWKLANAKVNRVWRGDGVEALARETFGSTAFEPEKLKSPAQVEKLPLGKDFATEHAYKPDGGTQLVPEGDYRKDAGPSKKSMFKPQGAKKRAPAKPRGRKKS